jgi:hypothetical protein
MSDKRRELPSQSQRTVKRLALRLPGRSQGAAANAEISERSSSAFSARDRARKQGRLKVAACGGPLA